MQSVHSGRFHRPGKHAGKCPSQIVLLRDAQIIVLWKCHKIGLTSSRCMILLVQFVEMIEASNAVPSTI